jgi:uncharacterized damage-inducible protein DinB
MNFNPSSVKNFAFVDLERELCVTRAVLERLPEDRYDWKPHEKSMSLGQLGMHVAFLPDWMRVTLAQDVLDVATAPQPPKNFKTRSELLARFDANAAALRDAVARFDPAQFDAPWSMQNAGTTVITQPRDKVYRVWCLNHLIHHRGQLCLYLRLLDVPVPTVYFNTADDPTWVFE